jgi:flavin reductase (DIM6/NTAB) family NADH-FMN oxidoreductase RutF
MPKQIGIFDAVHETFDKLEGDGALLVAGNPANPMTIGWGTIGIIWHMPIMTVLVRPTRYTFLLMEESIEFTVCLLPISFGKQVAFCGTKSGRDMNKIEKCGLKLEQGILVKTPFIAESEIHYECRVVHKHKLDPQTLDDVVISRYYPLKDFHMVYYGEILGVYRNS